MGLLCNCRTVNKLDIELLLLRYVLLFFLLSRNIEIYRGMSIPKASTVQRFEAHHLNKRVVGHKKKSFMNVTLDKIIVGSHQILLEKKSLRV